MSQFDLMLFLMKKKIFKIIIDDIFERNFDRITWKFPILIFRGRWWRIYWYIRYWWQYCYNLIFMCIFQDYNNFIRNYKKIKIEEER